MNYRFCTPVTSRYALQDITPLDFLWGYLKTKVFENQVTSVDKLKAIIQNAVDSVRPEMLVNSMEGAKAATGETAGEWREPR